MPILLHEKLPTQILITNFWAPILILIMEEDRLATLVLLILMVITILARIQTTQIREAHAWVAFVESVPSLARKHTCRGTTPTRTTQLQTINRACRSKILPPIKATAAWCHRTIQIILATTKAQTRVSKIPQAIQWVATQAFPPPKWAAQMYQIWATWWTWMHLNQCRTIKVVCRHLIITELDMPEAWAANTWAILAVLIIHTIHTTLGKMVELITAVPVSHWQQVVESWILKQVSAFKDRLLEASAAWVLLTEAQDLPWLKLVTEKISHIRCTGKRILINCHILEATVVKKEQLIKVFSRVLPTHIIIRTIHDKCNVNRCLNLFKT